MNKNIISNPTPSYIYFLDTAQECALRLQNVCKSLGKIAYSLKANPHPDVVQAVLCKVAFADVSSSGEIQTCLKLGINPNRMIFVGPYKSPDMLELAIDLGFKSIAVESIAEAKRICQLADKLQKSCSVIIRINFSTNLNAGALTMVTNSQFGVELSEIGQAISTFRKNKFVNIDGFHIYTGTRFLDANKLAENFDRSLDVMRVLCAEHSVEPKVLDIGGGFGVPLFESESDINCHILEAEIKKIALKHHKWANDADTIFESGRFIVSSCGVFITSVDHVKTINGKKYAIVNGGTNNFFAPIYGGALRRQNYRFEIVGKSHLPKTETITVCGPLCTPTDQLLVDAKTPPLEPGDVILFKNSGSYGYSLSMHGFISHPYPKEIIYNHNNSEGVYAS